MTPNRRLAVCAALVGLAAPIVALAVPAPAYGEEAEKNDPYANERSRMVRTVQRSFRANAGPHLPGRLSDEVADALSATPRHEFTPLSQRRYAYENRPLPIGYGQTISQPYIVALMTELADVSPGERALEIGTGSGYQAAILAEIGAKVRTIEIVSELGEQAATRLKRLGYDDVETRIGDGYFGWPEAAPFDAIIVTAAASHVPPPLTEQLAPGGRMVIPVGPPFVVQQLVLVTKDEDGKIRSRQLLPVQFVPFTRAE